MGNTSSSPVKKSSPTQAQHSTSNAHASAAPAAAHPTRTPISSMLPACMDIDHLAASSSSSSPSFFPPWSDAMKKLQKQKTKAQQLEEIGPLQLLENMDSYYVTCNEVNMLIKKIKATPEAELLNGMVSLAKKCFAKDSKLELLQFAAKHNHPEAHYELGCIYRNEYDDRLAFRQGMDIQRQAKISEHFYYAAKYGCAEAAKALEALRMGIGRWPQCEYYLGKLYEDGEGGVKKDTTKALHYYFKEIWRDRLFKEGDYSLAISGRERIIASLQDPERSIMAMRAAMEDDDKNRALELIAADGSLANKDFFDGYAAFPGAHEINALCYAIREKKLEIVEVLAGVTDLRREGSIPPIWLAIKALRGEDRQKIIKLLVKKEADINKKYFGSRPIHLSLEDHDYALERMLVEQGADINGTDPQGDTCLHKIAFSDEDEAAALLQIELGANPYIVNKDRHGNRLTALQIAKGPLGNKNVVKVIYDYSILFLQNSMSAFVSGMHARLGECSPIQCTDGATAKMIFDTLRDSLDSENLPSNPATSDNDDEDPTASSSNGASSSSSTRLHI